MKDQENQDEEVSLESMMDEAKSEVVEDDSAEVIDSVEKENDSEEDDGTISLDKLFKDIPCLQHDEEALQMGIPKLAKKPIVKEVSIEVVKVPKKKVKKLGV